MGVIAARADADTADPSSECHAIVPVFADAAELPACASRP
jgi:hypothetical protein